MAALAAGAVALAVYLFTCARDLTGGDAGELVTAARVLGIPRPPGHPLWCLLGHAFAWLPVGSVAFRIALLSAVSAAGTVALVSLLLTKLTGSRIAGVAAGLLLAFSRGFWSQAVIPEVHALTAFLLMGALWLAWRWYEGRTTRLLYALAATVGLLLANDAGAWPLALLFFAFVIAVHWNLWREPGVPFIALVAGLAPLLFYFYLPIRAEAQTIMNWGDPRDLQGFLDHVLRHQQAAETGAAVGIWARLLAVARDAAGQWTPFLGWLAIPGAALLIRRNWRFGLLLLGIFGAATAGIALSANFGLERQKLATSRPLFIPAWVVAGVWFGVALDTAGRALSRFRLPAAPRLAWGACALALVPLVLHWRANDRSHDRLVRQYVEAIVATLPQGAMIVPSADHAAFPLVYVQGVEKRRLDVAIVEKYGYTDPVLLGGMPPSLRVGVPRIPTAEADARFQDWLIGSTKRPVYFTQKQSLEGLPGCRLVQDGVLYRLVRSGEPEEHRADPWAGYDLSALADRPRDVTADVIASEVLLARGVHKAATGDKTGAKADFTESAAATEGIKQGYNNLGSACADAGLLEEAVEYLERAISLDPDYRTALRNLARVHMTRKKWDAAKKILDRLVALDPKDIATRYQLVDLDRASGQRRLAIMELEKIAKDNPKEAEPLVMAGEISEEEGDSLGALTYYQRALTLAPERLDLLDKLQVLLQSGSRPNTGLDPFRPPGVPGVPRPPNPLDGRGPWGTGRDPLDPTRRR